MCRRLIWQCIVISAVLVSPARGASFEGLGDLPGGGFSSYAQALSDDGSVVVGSGNTASGDRSFRWTPATGMVSLGNLPDGSFHSSGAEAVSADGSVIVGYGDSGFGWGTHKGYIWTQNEGMKLVGSLSGSTRYEAIGISADGSIVVGDGGAQAFRWSQGSGLQALGSLFGRANSRAVGVSADGSVIVGSSYNLPSWSNEQAFRWTPSGGMRGLGFLPGGSSSFALAVSPDGSTIVGTSASSAGDAGFYWTESSRMVSIGHLPGKNTTHPVDVSLNGQFIVGGSYSSPTSGEAFIWDAVHGMRTLKNVLVNDYGLNLDGWTLEAASGITPDGSVIVGWGTNPSGQTEAFRAVLTVPEPGTVTLVVLGAALSLRRRVWPK